MRGREGFVWGVKRQKKPGNGWKSVDRYLWDENT